MTIEHLRQLHQRIAPNGKPDACYDLLAANDLLRDLPHLLDIAEAAKHQAKHPHMTSDELIHALDRLERA